MYAEMALAHVMHRREGGGELAQGATRLFDRIVRDSRPDRIPRLFAKRLKPLRRLSDITDERRFGNRRYGGMRVIAVDAIHGTLNRADDFDYDFRPLRISDYGRWSKVATAMMNGIDLPPIEVVQVGDDYFVKDGHHRISVARALGFLYLDAMVEIWDEE